MSRYIIGSTWDRLNRNGLNGNFEYLFNQVDTVLRDSRDILKRAELINSENNNVKERLDREIGSLTEDSEVIDARGKDSVLSARLDRLDKKLYPIDFINGTIENNELARTAFVTEMNKKTKQLGMINTNFENPHGLHDANQYTTAKDLLLMGIHSLGYKELQSVMGVREKEIQVEGPNARNLNIETSVENSSINDNFDILGAKTGTLSSQVQTQNLLSFVGKKFDSKWYVASVMNARNRYTATRMALNAADNAMNSKVKFTGHKVNKSNGNFDEGLETWREWSGDPVLDYTDHFTSPASLNVNSEGVSSQVVTNNQLTFNVGNIFYISAMVKCTRHDSGGIGFTMPGWGSEAKASINRTTNGWEKISGVFTAQSNSSFFYVGGMENADLDGHIDNIVLISLTDQYGAGNEPTKSEIDALNIAEIDSEDTKVIVSQIPGSLVSYTPDNLPILFEQESEVLGYPASVTKVMTAMILLDNYSDMSQKFTIADSDVTGGSGSAYSGGDIITIQDALYSLMLESSNTIASAFSRIAGRNILLNKQ